MNTMVKTKALPTRAPPLAATTKYRDYAQEEAPFVAIPIKEQDSANFPSKLHYLLNELEVDGQSHLACWAPHGRCFFIPNREEFVTEVLRMWFSLTKFTSFQRQMNIYGFKRIMRGRDKGGYYHELFLRGKPFLANHIRRTEIKGMGPYRGKKDESDPNFHEMEPLPLVNKDTTKRQETNRPDEERKPEADDHTLASNATGSTISSLAPNSAFDFQRLLENRIASLQQQRSSTVPPLRNFNLPALQTQPLALASFGYLPMTLPPPTSSLSNRVSAANLLHLLQGQSRGDRVSPEEMQQLLQIQYIRARQDTLTALWNAAIP